jgi:hypothetical protein
MDGLVTLVGSVLKKTHRKPHLFKFETKVCSTVKYTAIVRGLYCEIAVYLC